jgi:hypothetical protein
MGFNMELRTSAVQAVNALQVRNRGTLRHRSIGTTFAKVEASNEQIVRMEGADE